MLCKYVLYNGRMGKKQVVMDIGQLIGGIVYFWAMFSWKVDKRTVYLATGSLVVLLLVSLCL